MTTRSGWSSRSSVSTCSSWMSTSSASRKYAARVARPSGGNNEYLIGLQERLVLVDDDGGRGVERLNVDDAQRDAAGVDERLDPIGDVDELGGSDARDRNQPVPARRHSLH